MGHGSHRGHGSHKGHKGHKSHRGHGSHKGHNVHKGLRGRSCGRHGALRKPRRRVVAREWRSLLGRCPPARAAFAFARAQCPQIAQLGRVWTAG